MAANHSARPRRNESGERLIRRFTRKIKKLGLIEEIKENLPYNHWEDIFIYNKSTIGMLG